MISHLDMLSLRSVRLLSEDTSKHLDLQIWSSGRSPDWIHELENLSQRGESGVIVGIRSIIQSSRNTVSGGPWHGSTNNSDSGKQQQKLGLSRI